jgi:recombinational DNA repair protein (RecF pathway)
VDDPHIHVESKVGHGEAAARDLLASTFGLAGDLPSVVTTGCGVRVPYAMTSPRPDRVTCLACREHARSEHLRLADQVERLSRMPGSVIATDQAKQAADRHRALADRFSGTQG